MHTNNSNNVRAATDLVCTYVFTEAVISKLPQRNKSLITSPQVELRLHQLMLSHKCFQAMVIPHRGSRPPTSRRTGPISVALLYAVCCLTSSAASPTPPATAAPVHACMNTMGQKLIINTNNLPN